MNQKPVHPTYYDVLRHLNSDLNNDFIRALHAYLYMQSKYTEEDFYPAAQRLYLEYLHCKSYPEMACLQLIHSFEDVWKSLNP